MERKIYISGSADNSALLAALKIVLTIIIERVINHAVEAARTAQKWLVSPRTYFAQDGDGVTVTGWQLIGANLLAAVVVVLLSIIY